MLKDTFNLAKLAMEKRNVAFACSDFATAISLYSHAMEMDPSNYMYPLNRSMANFKLERWEDVESDTRKVLELSPNNLTAVFRRSRSCRKLCQWDIALDGEYPNFGGNPTDGLQELKIIMEAEGMPPQYHKCGDDDDALLAHYPANDSALFTFHDTPNGIGAFSSRQLQRGDLVLSEKPILSIPTDALARIETEVRNLPPSHLARFLSLHNSHTECTCYSESLMGLFSTNSLALGDDASGICLRASRFNHSCSPNAQHSFHTKTGELRIYALCPIAVGDEIFIPYISGRLLYGRPRQARQDDLLARYHFTCACSVCSFPDAEARQSDARCSKLNGLWEALPRVSTAQGAQRLDIIVNGVRMFREEGLLTYADDFTDEAASVCSYHSDWASAKYWAKLTYQTRVDKFGEDSISAEEGYLDPKSLPLARLGPRKFFTRIRVEDVPV